MPIQEQLQTDLKAAMRSGEKLKVDVIRMTLAALKNVQIAQVKAAYDASGPTDAAGATVEIDRSTTLSDQVVLDTIAKEVKRRREAADLFTKGGRNELAASEEAEAAILETYLPRQLTADELRPLVAAAISELGASGPGDIGKVMPKLVQQFKGRADGRVLNQVARDILSKG